MVDRINFSVISAIASASMASKYTYVRMHQRFYYEGQEISEQPEKNSQLVRVQTEA